MKLDDAEVENLIDLMEPTRILSLHAALGRRIARMIRDEEEERREEARKAAEKAAKEAGFQLHELTGQRPVMPRRPARTNLPPKYRDIENPDLTWPGRGRYPQWLIARLNEGYAKETFRISG